MAHYIFIDLNGTLIGDSQKNLNFNQQHLSDFRKLVDELKSKKVIIGLCSDSPLEQLKVLSKRLGLDPTTPILAENGNLYFNGSEIISLKEFPSSLLEVAVTTAQKFADRKKSHERMILSLLSLVEKKLTLILNGQLALIEQTASRSLVLAI